MATHEQYIGGTWVPGPEYAPNINPSNVDETIGDYAHGDASQAAQAVAAAREAFPSWAESGIQARADALDAIGTEILSRRDELGRLLAREEGKTLAEAGGEVARAGHIFKYFGGEALRLHGELTPSVRPGVRVEVTREPLGVIGIITPWNFPIAIPAWKIAPALAYGNTVVFKPAELTPGCAWAIAEIISRSAIPEGVFNLVTGRGDVAGDAIVRSPDVSGISFTGSVATGHRVLVAASERHAKVQLEMGGKNPLVVLDDADLDTALDCAVNGAFFSTGQRCTASSRLIVTDAIHDRFVDALVTRLKALVVGDPLVDGTQIGPVVDQSQLDKDMSYLQIGKSEGATLAVGGERVSRDTEGFFLSPALFVDSNNDMRINREEIFGPVASVIRVKDYDEGLEVANDTEFGLSAGIVTSSLKHAGHFQKNSRAGMIMVNLPTAGVDYHVPFGGTKGSSFGPREQGGYAKEFYTTVKTAYVKG